MTLRSALLTAAAALALLLGVDTVAWWIATGRLVDAYAGWQSKLAAGPWQITAAPPARAGWPIAATVRLDAVRLGERSAGGFAWTAARVGFGVSLLHPRTLAVVPQGAQTLAGPGMAPIAFHAVAMRASLGLGAPIQSAGARATGLVVASAFGDVTVDAAALDADWRPGITRLRISAGPATLPDDHRWGLGRTIGAASLDLTARGAWPGGDARAAAARWRDAGGVVDVAAVALRWGALDASGSGRATLDAALQPAATLDLKVANPEAALSALADAGAITRNAATAAGAVLSLLELPARLTGRPGVLDLPLSLDDSTVALGQIPIARAPKLAWAGG